MYDHQRKNDWKSHIEKLEVSWHYNWSAIDLKTKPEGVDFVPMIWGYCGDTERFISNIRRLHEDKLAGCENRGEYLTS